METTKAHILAQLKKDILPLQGFKPVAGSIGFDGGLGFIKHAFPNASFPLGAIHEFFCRGQKIYRLQVGLLQVYYLQLCEEAECRYG